MNDLYSLLCVVAVVIPASIVLVYWFKMRYGFILNNELLRSSNSLRQQISQARVMLQEMPLSEPEDTVKEGLSSLLPMLGSLDADTIKKVLPKEYHVFLPVIEGFLRKMKDKGASGEGKSKEQPFIAQSSM